MKKTIKLSTNDLNNIIIESVKRVLNELDSKTYYNAADKASALGQNERGYEFSKYADNRLTNELGANDEEIRFNFNGFTCPELGLSYLKDRDKLDIYASSQDGFIPLKPGDQKMRIKDRRLIKVILQYFNKYKPDSQYNNKNYWIA